MDNKIEIVFEDDYIVAVNKPAGLLSIPDRFDRSAPCIQKYLERKYGEIFTLHRLDKGTSGVLLFAKDAESHKHLNTQFEQHTLSKVYHAVVKGVFPQDQMLIDIPILANPSKKGLSMPSARGKESVTLVNVLERYRNATLLECDLRTGRSHQLRVHVSAVGHPLLVDKDYGDATEFYLSSIKRKFNLKKGSEEQPIITRQTMHALSVEFTHPKTEERIKLNAEYPKDFDVLVKLLAKYSLM
jgi:RluA family pseudouridine synthase